MAKISGTVEFNIEACKGCELCVEACPQDCLAMSPDLNHKGYHFAVLIDDTCTGCVNCALVCPDAVITVYRERRPTSSRQPAVTSEAAI
ncbi:MAG: ferredoxin family protein [Fidelibacterota bacterium]|nr:MAG: ferredoxin family protein [Candidatus Neomarinimicrobiota bacterium]